MLQTKIDPKTELVPFRDLCVAFPDLLPQSRHPRTFMNWAMKGVAGVFLEFRYVGVQPCTTRVWLTAFIDAVTKARSTKA